MQGTRCGRGCDRGACGRRGADGKLLALDVKDGSVRWTATIGAPTHSTLNAQGRRAERVKGGRANVEHSTSNVQRPIAGIGSDAKGGSVSARFAVSC